MQIRWSPEAADDLAQIFDYIHADNPRAARRVAKTIYDRAHALAKHPYQGRRGRVEGTRELPLPPLPFHCDLSGYRKLGRDIEYYSRRATLASRELKHRRATTHPSRTPRLTRIRIFVVGSACAA